MGFKNLQAFNLAMLGKQAWNLVTKPNNLITKLFKARYFPNCDFFEASIGHNPSYVWRSIWSSKSVIQGGSKWSIGTGENISIWDQNWLMEGLSIPKPSYLQPYGDILKVQDLMMSNSKFWDFVKIRGIFDSHTVRRIAKTPLFGSVSDDTLVWKLEHDGVYSVRSAYHYCVNVAGTHNIHGVAGSWQLIWRLKIPPKVKNLLWRIGRNILPTRSKLNSRGINCPMNCADCIDAEEDIFYVLFLCPSSVLCWQQARLWIHVSAGLNANNNITDNLFSILNRLDKTQQEFFSVMVWSIWKRRNNKVWENITDNAQTVCERARHLITGWRNAQNDQTLANITQTTPQQTVWSKPSLGRYKCNIDASFSTTSNKVGIGICIRDDHGRFVAARTEWLEPILDVEVGEAMGLLRALKWVNELNWHNMDFEMDCKRVVDGLYSNRTYTSDLGAILSEIVGSF